MNRIHILSRTEGKNKKLVYSIFLTKRTDELSSKQMCAMNYLSLPICLCRKQFLYIQNTYLAEGCQPSDPLKWLTSSVIQILSYLNPFSCFSLCFHDWSCDRPTYFYELYDDFSVVKVFPNNFEGRRRGIENFNGGGFFFWVVETEGGVILTTQISFKAKNNIQ